MDAMVPHCTISTHSVVIQQLYNKSIYQVTPTTIRPLRGCGLYEEVPAVTSDTQELQCRARGKVVSVRLFVVNSFYFPLLLVDTVGSYASKGCTRCCGYCRASPLAAAVCYGGPACVRVRVHTHTHVMFSSRWCVLGTGHCYRVLC